MKRILLAILFLALTATSSWAAFGGELEANAAIDLKIGPFVDVGDGFTPQTDIGDPDVANDLDGTDEAYLIKHGAADNAAIDMSSGGLALVWDQIDNMDGWYNLSLTATETNTEGLLTIVIQDDTDCLPVSMHYMVLSEAAYNSKYGADDDDTGYMRVDTMEVGDQSQTANDNGADINTLITGVNVASCDANSIGDGDIAADAIGANELNADAATEIIDNFETQSQADPTGFWVNLKEINGIATQLQMLIDATTTIAADDDLEAVIVAGSVIAHLASTGADITTFKPSTDSHQSTRDAIAAAADVSYNPDSSSTVNTGDETNAYTDAAAIGGNSWQIGDANGGAGARHSATSDYTIDVIAEFNMGASRIATELRVVGYFSKATGNNVVEIYAYNYITISWDKLSIGTVDTEMRDDTGNQEYDFSLHSAYTDQETTPGEVKIGFVGTDSGAVAGADVLYLDYIAVSGSAVGGTTPQAIAAAVHEELSQYFHHIPGFTGKVRYVDGTNGDDENFGFSAAEPYATIGAAETAGAPGDMIRVFAGDYDEAVVLDQAGTELHCEIGTHILGANGVPLTISADGCKVIGAHFIPDAGQIGCIITSDYNYLELCETHESGTIGFQLATTAEHNEFVCMVATDYTIKGFDILGPNNIFRQILAKGTGNVTGIHLSNAAADFNFFDNSATLNNATAGWDVESGADDNLFDGCSDTDGDGTAVDDGANNTWRGFGDADVEGVNTIQIEGGDATDALDAAAAGGNILLSAEIAAITSQVIFTLATGSDDDDNYNDQTIVLYDDTNSDYPSVRTISDYTGGTKTVTIDVAPDFTLGADDSVKIFVTSPDVDAIKDRVDRMRR